MTAWFPDHYVDEMMPSDRDSPDAWLTRIDDGAPALDRACEFDAPELLKDGEIVMFTRRNDYGGADLTLRETGEWSVSAPMPAEAEQCCVTHGWQLDTLATSLPELVDNLKMADAEPDEYPVIYYTFVHSIAFRYDAASHKFIEGAP